MSHFSVLVFTREDGRGVEDLLAPYDENISYAPYVEYTKEQAIAKQRQKIKDYENDVYAKYLSDPKAFEEKYKDRQDLVDYLKNEFPKKLKWTDEECYQEMKKWYEDDMVDKNGNLLSTYNPNAKWDWYSTGGRWNGLLINKAEEHTNEDYAKEIDWDKTGTPFAYIAPNGVWHEKGKMGWWAMVSDEKDDNDWETEFMEFINELDEDVLVTVVDCHI